MLVWINGAFGVGKTHTAFELARRLSNAHVADPELIGFAIQKTLPKQLHADFQDRPQWRAAVIDTLADADAASDGPVLVPMTIVEAQYFNEIMSGLEQRGVDVRHFALTASPGTIRRRLRTRSGYWTGRLVGRTESWGMAQIDRCVSALAMPEFAEQIDTDGKPLDEVVEELSSRLDLVLHVPRLGRTRAQLRRAQVALMHIR